MLALWCYPHTLVVLCGPTSLTNSALFHSLIVQVRGVISIACHCPMFSFSPLGFGNKLLCFPGALATPSPKFSTWGAHTHSKESRLKSPPQGLSSSFPCSAWSCQHTCHLSSLLHLMIFVRCHPQLPPPPPLPHYRRVTCQMVVHVPVSSLFL